MNGMIKERAGNILIKTSLFLLIICGTFRIFCLSVCAVLDIWLFSILFCCANITILVIIKINVAVCQLGLAKKYKSVCVFCMQSWS